MTIGRVAPLLCMAVLLLPASGHAEGSPADVFVVAVERFNDLHKPAAAWIGPESPWRPYLAGQFSDFLSATDRETSLARQRVGECQTVLTLEQRGFFNNHPELIAAFGSPLVRTVFEQFVVPQVSYGFRRCVAFSRLIPVIEATKRSSFLEETYTVNLPWLSIWREPPHVAPEVAVRYRAALRSLFTLAFCARFKPAIADVIDLEKDVHTNQLDYGQLRWLERLAREAGLTTARLEEHVRYVRSMTPPRDIWLVDRLYRGRPTGSTQPTEPAPVTRLCHE